MSGLTKREALSFVRRLVKEQPKTLTTTRVLKQLEIIEEEVCRKAWTREDCIKALAEWKERTGQAPIISNLGADNLPSKFIIERVFGERASTVLKRYFPDGYTRAYCDRKYSRYTQEELSKFIKDELVRLQPISGRDYNKLRIKGSPTWETIAKKLGYSSWRELCSKVLDKEAVYAPNRTCKVLRVEFKSQLVDDLHSIISKSEGE